MARWRPLPDRQTAAFCRGLMVDYAYFMGLRVFAFPTPERHEVHGRVLGWLAAHPLPRRDFVRLLADRAERSPDPEVRDLCASLLEKWRDDRERERLLALAKRWPELPVWPEWRESSYRQPHGPSGLQLR